MYIFRNAITFGAYNSKQVVIQRLQLISVSGTDLSSFWHSRRTTKRELMWIVASMVQRQENTAASPNPGFVQKDEEGACEVGRHQNVTLRRPLAWATHSAAPSPH